MIPSRKLFSVMLLVAGAAGFAMAAGNLGSAAGPAQEASAPGESDTDPATTAAAGVSDAQATATRPLLPVEDYAPTGMTAQEAIEAHASATEGPEQPIPFNHRFHTQELGMQCAYCHGGTQSSAVAAVPPVELCMGCHRIVGAQLDPIQQLQGYWERSEPIPWEQVYKVPEFVQFPHNAHLRNDLACAECHGPVEEMDRVYKFSSLKMGWCLECHMGEGQESDYATDRLLAREFPPPQPPQPGQPVGLYPRTIDVEYGASRGPIECTACHY